MTESGIRVSLPPHPVGVSGYTALAVLVIWRASFTQSQ